MFSISKLIKFWAMGKLFTSRNTILYPLILRLAALAMLGIVIAVLVGTFISGGLFIGYNEMLVHGIEHRVALEILISAMVIILAIFGLIAWCYWRKVSRLTEKVLMRQAPLALRANDVVSAFMDGLMGEDR